MGYDHEAIRKAYPNVTIIDDGKGIFDANGDVVTVVQSNVDAARVELDKLNYRSNRVTGIGTTAGYDHISDQLEQLYHDMKDGKLGATATTGSGYVGITSVKTNIPKPE